VVHREEEREIPQGEEHGWTLKGTLGSSRRKIRKSARLSTGWGGGAGSLARAARRPFRTLARRGERRDGQRKHRGRWKEEELNTWSGAQKVQSGGRGGGAAPVRIRGGTGKQSRGGSGARRKKGERTELGTDL
jgi:hypothetical protein